MAAGLAAGIAAAQWLRPHPALALAAVVALALWAGLARRRTTLAWLLTVAALGALLYSYAQTAGRGDLAAWQGQKVTVKGTVVEEPELRKPRGVRYVLSVEQVDGTAARGLLSVQQYSTSAPAFGERVEFRATLKPPTGSRTPGGFDQIAYLARKGIYLTADAGDVERLGPGRLNPLRRAAVSARLRLEGVLKAALPPREAALSAGLIFGSRSDLPDDIKEAFKTSGVFHLLAVSGGNVAMVIMPILGLLRRAGLSKRVASAVAIPLVIFFVFLTGASPSVMRAGLMAGLVLLGDVLGRERNALNTLGAAATVLLLAQPGLLFDLGFQLSAGATLGILLFARRFETWLAARTQPIFGERVGQWLASGLSVTFAAQVMVEPISLHSFGTFALIAPVANLLVVSAVEPVVTLGSVATLVGLAGPALAKLLLLPVRAALVLLVEVVKTTAAIPFASVEVGHLPSAGVLAWYAALTAVAAPQWGQHVIAQAKTLATTRSAHRAVAVGASLVAVTALVWRVALAAPPDLLTVTFLDVGQGDAIIIRAPGGHAMLVDVGPLVLPDLKTGRPGYDAGAEVIVPFLRRAGVRHLDYVVLTHSDQDHAGGGASVLAAVPVGVVLKSDDHATESGYLAALKTAAQKQIPTVAPAAGQRFPLGSEALVDVINPPTPRFAGSRSDDNSNCIALKVRYRQVSVLLTCDVEAVVEEQWLAQGVDVKADLLKVSHHGSGHSSTEPFLQAVHPAVAVLSVGNGNSYGHPHAGTLYRLQAVGAEVWRTDRHGTVTASTDGSQFTLSAMKGTPADEQYRPLGLLGRRLLFAW